MNNKSPVSDEILTAYLDGEIPGKKHDAMTALIAQDEDLQQRLGKLQVEFDDVAQAFQHLRVPDFSEQIDVINRAANGKADDEKRSVLWTPIRSTIAASIMVASFAAGMFVNQLNTDVNNSPSIQVEIAKKPVKKLAKKPGWRQSVANYVALYTPETLNRYSSVPKDMDKNLRALSKDIDLQLESESIQVASLDYKQGRVLGLRGKPLVQLAYLHHGKTPVAFCIIKGSKGKKGMQFEQRNGLEIAHWSSDSHGFMVIGDLPKEELSKLAKSFSVRF